MVLLGEGRFFGVVPMGEGYTYGFGAVDGDRFEDPLVGRLERFRRRSGSVFMVVLRAQISSA
jgi:hypothetical protein